MIGTRESPEPPVDRSSTRGDLLGHGVGIVIAVRPVRRE